MKLEDFKRGMAVIYVPTHVNGDVAHVDCERGIVSSVGDSHVWVKYDCGRLRCESCFEGEIIDDEGVSTKCEKCRGVGTYDTIIMITGDEPFTAQATNVKELVIREVALG